MSEARVARVVLHRRREFMERFKRVPAHVLVQVIQKNTGRGVSWSGCTKGMLADSYAGGEWAGWPDSEVACLDLNKIHVECLEKLGVYNVEDA